VNLGKYIHELLLENETVIVPGFGAFVSNYKPAEISDNEIKPPSKEISFSHQIRNNDGLLVGYVTNREGISHFDALKAIEKEREDIIFRLDKGESVALDETGTLFYNRRNEIEFIPIVDANLLLDSFGLETILINKNEGKASESIIISEIEESETLAEPNQKTEQVELDPVSDFEPEPEILNSETVVEQNKTVEPVSEPRKTTVVNAEKKKEEKKKRSGVWYLLILIPILIAGYFVVQNNSKPEKIEPFQPKNEGVVINEVPIKNTEVNSSDSINLELEEPVLVENTELDSLKTLSSNNTESKIESSDSPVFYLVGGSFKGEENAEKYLLELKEKGFEPFHLGKRGNFYIIGIGTYKTESEAVKAKREFTERNTGSGAWIMEE
jgi:nucleoid DNA-binding protein/cell division protein FtsN